ncbi:MAG: DUF4422 domain-containing protein [Selenomonadaceae bacterium]|nr:DUF4422 domain-containing protein [Selenomonadaceae bacterium]
MRSYDSILLTAERSVEDLLMLIDWAEKSSNHVFVFLHCDSPTLKAMKQISIGRKNMNWTPALRGEWLEISVEHDDSCKAYVVMHKKYFLPKLPTGYEIIHAGKKNSTIDLGFQGDDTGDNISDLNLYLNELTVTYWAWKNAPRTEYIGFAHYERFFMLPDSETTDRSPEIYTPIKRNKSHVVTMQEAVALLQDCDILARKVSFVGASAFRVREENHDLYWEISKKYINQNIPQALEGLYIQNASFRLIACQVFFTRWKVFDEYCKWMFSWAIPAAREWMPQSGNGFKRFISILCEEMTQVFMMQHNLRIKYLPGFVGDKESTPEKPIF